MSGAAPVADPSSADFPLVEQFLAKLPEGVASYPQCQSRGTTLGRLVDRLEVVAPAGGLPPEVECILRDPPRGPWIPTAPYLAALVAIREMKCPVGPEGDAMFHRELEQTSREIYGSARFRVMFFLASPSRMLSAAARRWEGFYRGTSLAVIDQQPTSAVASLRHPPHLSHNFADVGWGQAIAVALESSGASGCSFELERPSASKLLIHLSWR